MAVVHDENNEPIPDIEIHWRSSDTMIAKVTLAGMLYGLSTGAVSIGAESIVEDAPTGETTSAQPFSATSVGSPPKALSGGTVSVQAEVARDTTTLSVSQEVSIGSAEIEQNVNTVDSFRAFPEAEGWGAEALTRCSRSYVQVIRVTNLQDSGYGSLRDAIAQVQPDVLSIILFDVAGYIDLDSRIEITDQASCLYIAGQSAPGGGITVRAWDKQALMFRDGPLSDVVIRYLRFRNGTRSPGTHTAAQGILIGAGTNLVFDHLSFSWANDQLMSIYKYANGWGPLNKVTLQRSLFAEPLATSPVCYSIGGDKTGEVDGVPEIYKVDRITFHHNAALHCSHRAPATGGGFQEVINSVVYNWNIGAMHNTRKSYTDFIGNYFKRGPMNRPLDTDFAYEFSQRFATNVPSSKEPDGYRIIGNTRNIDGRAGPSLFLSDNIGFHNTTGGSDNWAMTSKYKDEEKEDLPESYYSAVEYADVGLMPISVEGIRLRRDSRLDQPPIPVSLEAAESAWNSLIEDGDVGANRRLSCRGDWIRITDAVDERVLTEARNGTGRTSALDILSQDEVGGFPDLQSGSVCSDSDNDGMPDQFEERFGLDPQNADDALRDDDGDGYTNLEEFLNGSTPR